MEGLNPAFDFPPRFREILQAELIAAFPKNVPVAMSLLEGKRIDDHRTDEKIGHDPTRAESWDHLQIDEQVLYEDGMTFLASESILRYFPAFANAMVEGNLPGDSIWLFRFCSIFSERKEELGQLCSREQWWVIYKILFWYLVSAATGGNEPEDDVVAFYLHLEKVLKSGWPANPEAKF